MRKGSDQGLQGCDTPTAAYPPIITREAILFWLISLLNILITLTTGYTSSGLIFLWQIQFVIIIILIIILIIMINIYRILFTSA